MASVRFVCGTQDLDKWVEGKLSDFLGTDDAVGASGSPPWVLRAQAGVHRRSGAG